MTKIGCPTLVVVGARHEATPVTMPEALAAGIARATLRIVGPAGHPVTEEPWAELKAALLAFLAGPGERRGASTYRESRLPDDLHAVAICQRPRASRTDWTLPTPRFEAGTTPPDHGSPVKNRSRGQEG